MGPLPPPPPEVQLPEDVSSLLTVGEAACLIRVHPNSLRNWERQGKVSSVRIGTRRDRRFRRNEILKLLESPEIQNKTLPEEAKSRLNTELNPRQLISIIDAAKGSPYSAEYLSFLARRGMIEAIKLGRNWLTTKAIVSAYTQRNKKILERRRPSTNTAAVPDATVLDKA